MDKKAENSKIKLDFSERLNSALNDRGYTKAAGWTNKKIGVKMGVTEAAISKLRTGNMLPSIEAAVKMSIWLKISFEWLMTGRGQMDIKASDLPKNIQSIAMDLADQPADFIEFFCGVYWSMKDNSGNKTGLLHLEEGNIKEKSGNN